MLGRHGGVLVRRLMLSTLKLPENVSFTTGITLDALSPNVDNNNDGRQTFFNLLHRFVCDKIRTGWVLLYLCKYNFGGVHPSSASANFDTFPRSTDNLGIGRKHSFL